MFVRAYLRASTKDQKVDRALKELQEFSKRNGFQIASYYKENESGASLQRPELFRLLSDCQNGDVLLVEQVDRLSRLNKEDWEKLKTEIISRGIKIVALDLPTSWELIFEEDSISSRIKAAFNSMMLDMLAAIARKDYEDRRKRQEQGIQKAKIDGKYKGRPENKERNLKILNLLNKGLSWSEVSELTGASRSTLSRIKRKYAAEA